MGVYWKTVDVLFVYSSSAEDPLGVLGDPVIRVDIVLALSSSASRRNLHREISLLSW